MMTEQILLLRPNQNTYEWGQKAADLIKQYGYPLIDIQKDEVTSINVKKSLEQYKPRMLITFSDGTPSCIRGQQECVISRFKSRDENILNKMIVISISPYTTVQLGESAIITGTDSYFGYDDIIIFPSDGMNSQDLFRDVHITYLRSLLEGKTVKEAEKDMNDFEDSLIKSYKKLKYISLPLLWNKEHRKILGNKDVRLNPM